MQASTCLVAHLNFARLGPEQQGPFRTSRQQDLASSVAGVDLRRVGIVCPASGALRQSTMAGVACYAAIAKLWLADNLLVGFLRGLLTNHGMPLTLQSSGRYQFAPQMKWCGAAIIAATVLYRDGRGCPGAQCCPARRKDTFFGQPFSPGESRLAENEPAPVARGHQPWMKHGFARIEWFAWSVRKRRRPHTEALRHGEVWSYSGSPLRGEMFSQ